MAKREPLALESSKVGMQGVFQGLHSIATALSCDSPFPQQWGDQDLLLS